MNQAYRTLCFKTKEQASKNEGDIKSYFGIRILNSAIKKGVDERGNKGYYIKYDLKP